MGHFPWLMWNYIVAVVIDSEKLTLLMWFILLVSHISGVYRYLTLGTNVGKTMP